MWFFLVLGLVLSTLTLPARAAVFGSNLAAVPNAGFGCELAPILDPINGFPVLAPTGQSTCTFRNVGYINSLQLGSFVPGNGRITRIRLRSGPNPAPLQLTIMQGSPGLCCTARAFGKVFQPIPNAITSLKVNMRVHRTLHRQGTNVFQVTDVVALSAVGPGSLPLHDEGTAGTFTSGSGLTQLWYPLTQAGDPRVEGAVTADGLELLFQWTFKRR